MKIVPGYKNTTVDLFLKHVIYSINATAQVEIKSDNNDSSADNIAKIILKHYVADICISASISVPKGDEKTYYELLMEIINTEENQDDIEEISAKLSHSSSHNSNSNGYNNNNNDNVSRETSYNSNSSQSLSYNVSSQSSQGSPTSKKRKSKSKFRTRVKRHKRWNTGKRKIHTQRERGGERCEKYTHTHMSHTYVMWYKGSYYNDKM